MRLLVDNRMVGFAILGLLLVPFAGGCAHTPEPRYYTLNMTPSGTVHPDCNIEVDRLRPHDALTRTDILVKKSPTQIEYYALDRWAATLSELIPEKLQAEFGDPDPQRRTIAVSGTILAFEQVDRPDGADAHIKLELDLRNEGASRYDTPLLRKLYEVTLPANAAEPAAVVETLSKGLEEIAAEIAADAGAVAQAGS